MDDFDILRRQIDVYMFDSDTNGICTIIVNTSNPELIYYIFTNLKYSLNLEYMIALSTNTKLSNINIAPIYAYLYNIYIDTDLNYKFHIIINRIIRYTNCNINYKLLAIMFKIFNTLLLDNLEDLNNLIHCIPSNMCFYLYNVIHCAINIDIYFNIINKTSINTLIILLFDTYLNDLNSNIYKCLNVLLNHDQNLHILYFLKIFQMKSDESIYLIDLLFKYDIDEILEHQLELLSNLQYNTNFDIIDSNNKTLPFKFDRLNNKGLEYILK